MTPYDPLSYDPLSFVGREDIIKQIIADLLDPKAHARRRRSLMIEGPSGRGKTWLLSEVARRLSDPDGPYAQAGITTLYLVKEDFANLGTGDRRWHPIIAQICACLRHYPRLNGVLAWPLDLLPAAPDPQSIPPRPQATNPAYLAEATEQLRPFPASNLFPEIVNQIESTSTYCILIVDGIEETTPEDFKEFEATIVQPLFRSEKVRLLSSRRVDNPTHSWSHYFVRQQTHLLGALEPFEPDPYKQQIEKILEQLAPGPDVSLRSEEIVKTIVGSYQWGNPGINRALVKLAYADPTRINRQAIERLLLERLQAPRPEIGPAQEGYPTEEVYQWLKEIVAAFGDMAKQPGILRLDIGSRLQWSNNDTAKRLGYIQSIGAGVNERSGRFRIYPEFVELLRWQSDLNSDAQ